MGFEEYQVDTNGIVYSKKGRPLKPSINHNGYQIINFYVNNKRTGVAVHTIVAKQFIPNFDINKTQVNHRDGDKSNNTILNLEWVTPLENTRHSIEYLHNKNDSWHNSNSKAIIAFREKTREIAYVFDSLADAGRYFSADGSNFRIKQNSIHRAMKKKRPVYMGYIWLYI